MRVVERSEFLKENGEVTLENRVRATLKNGLRWYGEIMAQQAVTQRLSPILNNEHVLVRNLLIPGNPVPLPMVLISPQGVRLILASPLRGVFRAKGDEWMTFDSGARRFKRVRPNLQMAAIKPAEILHKHLKGAGFPLPDIEAVLILTDPRTHVDTARPRSRVVLSDAIEHFGANLLQLPPIMDQEDISAVLQSLLNPHGEAGPQVAIPGVEMPPAGPIAVPRSGPAAAQPVSELRATMGGQFEEIAQEAPVEDFDWRVAGEKFISRADQVQRSALQAEQAWERKVAPQVSTLGRHLGRRLPRFSRNQWILLGAMAFFEFIILVITVLIIASDILRY